MSKKFKRRIFINKNDHFYDFMWADLSKDKSIVIGLSGFENGEIEEIYSPIEGHLNKNDLHKNIVSVAPKFTFHASGFYKGEGGVGISANSVDRPTIKGVPLNKISEPRRMLEILLPKNIYLS